MQQVIEKSDALPPFKGHIICELLADRWPGFLYQLPRPIQKLIAFFYPKGEKVVERKEYDNLVVNVAKNGFAALLNDESGFTGVINYGAIGTGAASPAATDTQLGTEVARTTIESGSNSRVANVTTMAFYFDPTVGNGTLKEFGAFIDGTASANTGSLFDRVNIDVVKTSLNSLRITLQITVS